MVGIGLLCALLIVLTYEGTFPRIEKNKAEALEKAIFKVLPGIEQTVAYELDEQQRFQLASAESSGSPKIYAGFNANNELTGLAIEASGQGYADVIRILYGYIPDQEAIVGMYVLESKETPGLGDKIEKDPNFLDNFKALDASLTANGNSLKNRIIPVKQGEKTNPWEVEGITGATITSRAIGDMLGVSTEQWIPLIHQQRELFIRPSTPAQ